jgi:Fe2+ transport system protein FeoA
MDVELIQLRLTYHEAMAVKLQDTKPELAIVWLAGAEILRKRLMSLGVNIPEENIHHE